MDLTPKRRKQIDEVVFDRFVLKYVIESDMLDGEKIDLRKLNYLASQLKCNVHALSISIGRSCGRISSMPVTKTLPKDQEELVMWAAAKHHIMNLEVPLKNYKREFGNVTVELNAQNPDLNLKIKELLLFAYPIYLQILEDIFE